MKPIPAMVPAPATDAQPTGGRSRPPLSRVASHVEPAIPIGLPSDVAEDDPERDGRRERRREEPGAQVDAGVRQREERHDHVARPRMPERTAAARSATRPTAAPPRAVRASSRVGCSRKRRKISLARSRSVALRGYASAMTPPIRPATTGSTPDS